MSSAPTPHRPRRHLIHALVLYLTSHPLNDFIICPHLSYISHLLALTHLPLIHAISPSSSLHRLMPFHSSAPPLSSCLISHSLSTWDIEAIKTGVQKKAEPANPFCMPRGTFSLEYRDRIRLQLVISKSQLLFLWLYYLYIELMKEERGFLQNIKLLSLPLHTYSYPLPLPSPPPSLKKKKGILYPN